MTSVGIGASRALGEGRRACARIPRCARMKIGTLPSLRARRARWATGAGEQHFSGVVFGLHAKIDDRSWLCSPRSTFVAGSLVVARFVTPPSWSIASTTSVVGAGARVSASLSPPVVSVIVPVGVDPHAAIAATSTSAQTCRAFRVRPPERNRIARRPI